MIAATHNCGCPVKLSSLIPETVELQTPCSPCCFQPYGAPHHSQIQTIQRCTQPKTVQKLKHIYPTSEEVCCCINRKNFRHVPSCSEHIPSVHLSSVSPQYSHCCAVDAPRSRSEAKLKNLEMSNTEQTDKVVSEIVRKQQPYKEIEAVINDNRVIIRMHKESVKEEYDPPCECIGQVALKESALSQRKCNDGVVFDMAHGNLELCRTPREDAPSVKKTCEEAGCRTITLYPNIKEDARSAYRMDSREVKKSKMKRPIDLEENPNIFLLRIRKHCDSGDKRQQIDLEFRAPRPWLPRNGKKKDLLKPEELEEYEDADKEYEADAEKEYEDGADKEYKDDEEHEDNIDAHEENH